MQVTFQNIIELIMGLGGVVALITSVAVYLNTLNLMVRFQRSLDRMGYRLSNQRERVHSLEAFLAKTANFNVRADSEEEDTQF